MNNTYSSEQTSKTGIFASHFIFLQYELDIMARFMEIKSLNRKVGQDQIGKKIGCSGNTLQRYRQDMKMLSPYRISSNFHKRRQRIQIQLSMMIHIVSLTSKDLK